MKKLKYILVFIMFLLCFQCISFAVEKKATVTIILLDISGSMDSINSNNKTRIQNAINVISNTLNNYNNFDWIGLRTIGLPPNKTFEKLINDPSLQSGFSFGHLLRKACNSSELLVDITEGGASTIKNMLNYLNVTGGSTPIEYTLVQTIENDFARFPRYMKKHIILITDGQEGCGGNPCSYIKKIREERDDITIDVISMLDEGSNFSLYNCLAETTGGTIYNINSDVIDIKPLDPNITVKRPKNISQKSNGLVYKHFLLEFN